MSHNSLTLFWNISGWPDKTCSRYGIPEMLVITGKLQGKLFRGQIAERRMQLDSIIFQRPILKNFPCFGTNVDGGISSGVRYWNVLYSRVVSACPDLIVFPVPQILCLHANHSGFSIASYRD